MTLSSRGFLSVSVPIPSQVQLLAPPAEEGRGASGTQRSQSTGRGYAHRLKAKQVCKGLGIIAEVEKVLQVRTCHFGTGCKC